jgi:hypothetical protein
MNKELSHAMLFYNGSNGAAATGQLDSGASFQEFHEFAPGTFGIGWTHIVSQ